MADIEPLCRRLLFEGDSGIDVKRIILLIKAVNNLAGAAPAAPDCTGDNGGKAGISPAKRAYDKVIQTLTQCEHVQSKSSLILRLNELETERYTTIKDHLQLAIQMAEDVLAEAVADLQRAKEIRTQRLEYDEIAKTAEAEVGQPQRQAEIDGLTAKIAKLTAEDERLKLAIQIRQNQFASLLFAAEELQKYAKDSNFGNSET